MFRALSTRRSLQGYEKLGEDEPSIGLLDVKLQRSATLPAGRFLGSQMAVLPVGTKLKPSPSKKASGKSSSHPLFSLFERRSRKSKKATVTAATVTARPEFARYLNYVREGGSWDPKSNVPVIYYR
ncbi:hypothetical protein SAY87_025027 [Trapa incisa]|uniref:Uncharacterized protein n=1 Tax=Trapa incisa TaxID=236973 RepID=A0AAN7GGT1_9MYRT|nr:hypothetical protein SAY87_025027 [Trapa incisa]